MKWYEKLLRMKYTELPKYIYWLVGSILFLIIIALKLSPASCCKDDLIQNIALGILGSLICSGLLDRAGGKAKLRRIRAQYNKLICVMKKEKDKIVNDAETYHNLLNIQSEEPTDGGSIKELYSFPSYVNSDPVRAKYYREQVLGHLNAILSVSLDAEALLDEARYLLFKKEKNKTDEAKETCKQLQLDQGAYESIESLSASISTFENDYKNREAFPDDNREAFPDDKKNCDLNDKMKEILNVISNLT